MCKVLTWGQVEHILFSWKVLDLPELCATILKKKWALQTLARNDAKPILI